MIDEQIYDQLLQDGDDLHNQYMEMELKEEELDIDIPASQWKELLLKYQKWISEALGNIKYLENTKSLLDKVLNGDVTLNQPYQGDMAADYGEIVEQYNALYLRKVEIESSYICVYNRSTYKRDGSGFFVDDK